MTIGEFKAYMQEQDRERKFNERWMNRDYNNEKATYSRFYHKNPLIRMTGNQIKIGFFKAPYFLMPVNGKI